MRLDVPDTHQNRLLQFRLTLDQQSTLCAAVTRLVLVCTPGPEQGCKIVLDDSPLSFGVFSVQKQEDDQKRNYVLCTYLRYSGGSFAAPLEMDQGRSADGHGGSCAISEHGNPRTAWYTACRSLSTLSMLGKTGPQLLRQVTRLTIGDSSHIAQISLSLFLSHTHTQP
ncbi:hypothetical protein LX36DRAFT_277970 [Colletotrichum falcatum]|nr:hypothetical protein LX36DRAFT_277970 [Colletotrichum falcatum]